MFTASTHTKNVSIKKEKIDMLKKKLRKKIIGNMNIEPKVDSETSDMVDAISFGMEVLSELDAGKDDSLEIQTEKSDIEGGGGGFSGGGASGDW